MLMPLHGPRLNAISSHRQQFLIRVHGRDVAAGATFALEDFTPGLSGSINAMGLVGGFREYRYKASA